MGFDPVSMLVIGSTALGVAGSIQSGEAAAGQAEWNAAMSRYDATYQQQKSAIEEARVRRGTKRTVGEARVAAGASGFALESESTQQAIDEIEKSGEIDAALIRHQGDIGEWKGLAEAAAFESQAEAERDAGFFDAVTTLFSGASKFAKNKKIGGPFEEKKGTA